jgi:U3 small nucleolar RNA-associated protein 13
VSQDQTLLAMCTNNEFVKVYNLNTWDCQLLRGHTDLILSVAGYVVDETCSYLASSSKDATVRVWKLKRRGEDQSQLEVECVKVCEGHTQDVGAVAFSRLDMSFMVTASIDTTMKLWKISTDDGQIDFRVKFTVKAHEKDINSVCVSPNDKLIASCSSDKTAKVWDSLDGTILGILRGHKRGIWHIQFSTVDQLVATSSADATIKLWSLVDFSCVKTFEGHLTSVLKVFFLNNGSQLISSASDGLIKIWNIKTNECCSTFDEHTAKTWSLCVNKNETSFVSGGADGKLVIWKDVSQEERQVEMEKREEVLLQEQELQNCLKEKKWKKALALAILLDRPFKAYEIIKNILEQSAGKVDDSTRADLEKTLLKLRDDQIKSILKYALDWNTNTKFYQIAQIVFELVLRNYPPEFLTADNNASREESELAQKLVEQFLPYTQRHYSRLNKLAQQCMFIDFAWQNMKLEN